MNNHKPADKRPVFDWDELIARAKLNGPAELYHALKQYAAWFQTYRGGFKQADYPLSVMDYLNGLIKPTGKRGRPQLTEWAKLVYRDSYEHRRLMFKITKLINGKIIDEFGNKWPVTEKPSALAIIDVANDMQRSVGAATDAINPERKEKYRTKRMKLNKAHR